MPQQLDLPLRSLLHKAWFPLPQALPVRRLQYRRRLKHPLDAPQAVLQALHVRFRSCLQLDSLWLFRLPPHKIWSVLCVQNVETPFLLHMLLQFSFESSLHFDSVNASKQSSFLFIYEPHWYFFFIIHPKRKPYNLIVPFLFSSLFKKKRLWLHYRIFFLFLRW